MNHEHQNPNAGICWDEPIVYKMCADSKTDLQACKSNWLETKKGSDLIYSAYDRYSIMHYRIKNKLTSCDYDAPWNTELSMMDKRWVQFLYPFPSTLEQTVIRKFEVHSTEIKVNSFQDELGNDALEIFGRVGIISSHDLATECYEDVSFPGCFEVAMDYIHLLIDIKEGQEVFISKEESSGKFLSKASFEHSADDKYFLVVQLYDKDYFNENDHYIYIEGGFIKKDYLVVPLDFFHKTEFGIQSYYLTESKSSIRTLIEIELDLVEVALSAK